MKIYAKIIEKNNKLFLFACDVELINSEIKYKDVIIKISEKQFKGEIITLKELRKIIKSVDCCFIVGKCAEELFKEKVVVIFNL
jgi:hypothetical protein